MSEQEHECDRSKGLKNNRHLVGCMLVDILSRYSTEFVEN